MLECVECILSSRSKNIVINKILAHMYGTLESKNE